MKLFVTIDRIEGDFAVLFLADTEQTVNWPCCFLPASATEGDILTLNLEINDEATAKAREEAEKLYKEVTRK